MKTKQLFLSVHREYDQVWYVLTDVKTGALSGHMPVGVIDMPIDNEKVLSDLDAFDKDKKEGKRARLLAQLAELDNQESEQYATEQEATHKTEQVMEESHGH